MRIKVTKVERAEKGMAQVTLLVAERNVEAFMANFPGWLEASVKPEADREYLGDPPRPPKDMG